MIIAFIIFYTIFIAFIAAIIIFIREYRIKKKDHLQELHEVDLYYKKELLKNQIEIQEQTMKHIGREIHDNVGQKLTLSSLYLQQLVYNKKAAGIIEVIKKINLIVDDSLKELRKLSKSLTDNIIKESSIDTLIRQECKKINDLQKCKVAFSNSIDKIVLPHSTKSVLLRVTQEFLQNSLKHSDCNNITITLFIKFKMIHFELKDDGVGFNKNEIIKNGIGLINMQKRVELLSGTFEIFSKKLAGVRLKINLPLNEL